MSYKSLRKVYLKTSLAKLFSIAINLLTVSYFYRFIPTKEYELYVYLFSMISWIYFLDFGIGKGLRNQITLGHQSNNVAKMKELVFLGYSLTSLVAVFILIMGAIFSSQITNYILNNFEELNIDIKPVLILFFAIIIIKLISSFGNQLLLAVHKSELVVIINSIGTGLLLLFSWIMFTLLGVRKNLLQVIFSLEILISSLILIYHLVVFTPRYFNLIRLLVEHKTAIRNSLLIFFIQVLNLSLLALDRNTILMVSTPEEVVDYDLLYRIFMLAIFPFSIIMRPIWSSINGAKIRSDFKWIKHTTQRLYTLSIFVLVVNTILIIVAPHILVLWIGDDRNIHVSFYVLMALLIAFFNQTNIGHDILMGFQNERSYFQFLALGVILKYLVLSAVYLFGTLNKELVILTSIMAYMLIALLSRRKVNEIVVQ